MCGEKRVCHLTQTLQLAKPCKTALCPKDQSLLLEGQSEPQDTSVQDWGHKGSFWQSQGWVETARWPVKGGYKGLPFLLLFPNWSQLCCSILAALWLSQPGQQGNLSGTLLSSGPFLPDASSTQAARKRLLLGS